MHVFHLGTHADVVPGDERTRHCGERSTTPNRPKPHFVPKTWCPTTKEQGVAGSEAPRPTRRSPILFQRRGARRRKNRALREAKHHVQPAEIRFCSKDVVPVDGRTRFCGERSTTFNRPNPILLRRRGARRRKNKELQGAKHHVQPGEAPFCPEDVVPVDERIRHCGERSTTICLWPAAEQVTGQKVVAPQRQGKTLQTTSSRY